MIAHRHATQAATANQAARPPSSSRLSLERCVPQRADRRQPPASAQPAWPRMTATGTGRPRCTGPQAFLERAGQRWQEPEARYRRDSLDQVRAPSARSSSSGHARDMALSSDEALDLASGQPPSLNFPRDISARPGSSVERSNVTVV
jgi:hypothetical protein